MISKSVLVVAAHPDDEVLGCGGTLAKLAKGGAVVNVAFMSDGIMSRTGKTSEQQVQLRARRAVARKAADVLGVNEMTFGNLPDNRMDTVARLDVTQTIEALIEKHRPDTVFTHHCGDVNVDHRRVHDSVVTACRPQPGHPVRTLLCFEVPSSTEWQLPFNGRQFSPNWFVDIADTLGSKLAALDAYAAELREWPHPRSRESVEHLARWRGATVGVPAAEAFVLGRRLG